MGMTYANFQMSEKTSVFKDELYFIVNGFQIKSPESFTSLVEILSVPGAFQLVYLENACNT